MNQLRLFIFGAILTATSWGEVVRANSSRVLLNEESVPIILDRDAIQCADAVPDHGFGAQHGYLSIIGSKIFDRTLRLEGADYFIVELPDSVTCKSLDSDLKKLSDYQKLVANRKVYREWKKADFELSRTITQQVGEVQIEIPLQVKGKNAVVTGNQKWIEENLKDTEYSDLYPPFTKVSSYYTLTQPQSGSHGIGLYCDPSYPGASEYQLSLGQANGRRDSDDDLYSNLYKVTKTFPSGSECEEARSVLLKYFQAVDPQNRGSWLKVDRSLESAYRSILGNQGGDQLCQEVEVDTIEVSVHGTKFVGAKSFSVRTVDLQKCAPETIADNLDAMGS